MIVTKQYPRRKKKLKSCTSFGKILLIMNKSIPQPNINIYYFLSIYDFGYGSWLAKAMKKFSNLFTCISLCTSKSWHTNAAGRPFLCHLDNLSWNDMLYVSLHRTKKWGIVTLLQHTYVHSMLCSIYPKCQHNLMCVKFTLLWHMQLCAYLSPHPVELTKDLRHKRRHSVLNVSNWNAFYVLSKL